MSFTIPDNDEAFNNNQSVWMQTDINALVAGLAGDGVLSGCAVSEDGGGVSMDLDVTSGAIQINGVPYSITGSAAAVTIGVADGSNPRIDLVSAKNDDTLNVTAGTAAANPKAPDIPADSVLLAMVYVPASDTTIADNQIIDKRVVMGMATYSTVLELTLSLDTSIYSDGDVLAATQELANAVRTSGGTGVIQSIGLIDDDDQGQALDIVIFDSNVSLGSENSPVSIADGDADNILGIVEVGVGDYVDLINSQWVTMNNLGIVVKPTSGTSLYIGVISRGAGTYTASGITLRIGVLQD